jgi:hypothetical protein
MATDHALINAPKRRNSISSIHSTINSAIMKMEIERNSSLTCPITPAPILSEPVSLLSL